MSNERIERKRWIWFTVWLFYYVLLEKINGTGSFYGGKTALYIPHSLISLSRNQLAFQKFIWPPLASMHIWIRFSMESIKFSQTFLKSSERWAAFKNHHISPSNEQSYGRPALANCDFVHTSKTVRQIRDQTGDHHSSKTNCGRRRIWTRAMKWHPESCTWHPEPSEIVSARLEDTPTNRLVVKSGTKQCSKNDSSGLLSTKTGHWRCGLL